MPLTDRPSEWYNSRLWGPAIPAIFVVCLAIWPGLAGFVLALVILAILMMLAKVDGDKAKRELETSSPSATTPSVSKPKPSDLLPGGQVSKPDK